jgi:hypothetical protein
MRKAYPRIIHLAESGFIPLAVSRAGYRMWQFLGAATNMVLTQAILRNKRMDIREGHAQRRPPPSLENANFQ